MVLKPLLGNYIKEPIPSQEEVRRALDFYYECCGRYCFYRRPESVLSASLTISQVYDELREVWELNRLGELAKGQFSEDAFFALYGRFLFRLETRDGDNRALDCEPLLKPDCPEGDFGPLLKGKVSQFRTALFVTAHLLMEVHQVTRQNAPEIWWRFRKEFPFHTPYISESNDLLWPSTYLSEGAVSIEKAQTVHYIKCIASAVLGWLGSQSEEGLRIREALYDQIRRDYYHPDAMEYPGVKYFTSVYQLER